MFFHDILEIITLLKLRSVVAKVAAVKNNNGL